MAVRDALERLLADKRGQILGFEPGERPGWDRVVALATVGLGTFTVRHERFEVAPEREGRRRLSVATGGGTAERTVPPPRRAKGAAVPGAVRTGQLPPLWRSSLRITPPRALVFSAFALAVLVAGCGGGGALDYGTTSINTASCTNTGVALVSPTGTTVATTTSSVEISAPPTSPVAETPTAYDLILEDNTNGSDYTLGTLTVASIPAGGSASLVYLTATIPDPPLAPTLPTSHQFFVTLYNIASTCEVKSFASFTTASS
jgi:hypothetical protein